MTEIRNSNWAFAARTQKGVKELGMRHPERSEGSLQLFANR